jgi:tRNA pseudouridine38-40 synthase
MKNFKLTIEYDGTDFYGWQRQPEVRTVQGVLEGALGNLMGGPVEVSGCCRTDTGVHARAFVGNFKAETALSPDTVHRAVNAKLPEDIVVRRVEEPEKSDFHARHDCIARRYLYKITKNLAAIDRRVLAYTKYDLDAHRMAEAAPALVGENDFSSFAPAALADEVSTVCNVMAASISQEGDIVSLEVKADRFLHHMVRNIVGTLIEVGRGRLRPEQIEQILRKKDRRAAGPTAPARGLVLMEAYYRD